jgi:hypothetical protein
VLGHERLQLAGERRMLAECEVRVDAVLDGGETELLEAGTLDGGELLVGEVGESRAPPQPERLVQPGGSRLGLAAGERAPALLDEALEPQEVELLGARADEVAGGTCHDDAAAAAPLTLGLEPLAQA